MTLDEIYALFAGKSAVVLTDGSFAELGALLGAFGLSQLEVDSAAAAHASGKVTLDGVVTVLGAAAVRLHLEITGATQHPLALTLSLPSPSSGLDISAVANAMLARFGVTLPSSVPALDLTQLVLTFGLKSKTFAFTCASTFDFSAKPIPLTLAVVVANGATSPQSVTGSFTIAGQTFVGDFAESDGTTSVLFTWSSSAGFTLNAFAAAIGFVLPPLPEPLDLSLRSAEFRYDFAAHALALGAQSASGALAFVTSIGVKAGAHPGARLYALNLDLAPHVDLRDLPVIGPDIPSSFALALHIALVIADATLNAADVTAVNALIAALGKTAPPALIPKQIAATATIAALITVGKLTFPLVLPLSEQSAASTPRALQAQTVAYVGQTLWFPIASTFGPVLLARVGMQYRDRMFAVLFDAAIVLGDVQVGIDGLGIASPLASFSPTPELSGLAVTVDTPGLQISGGLLVVQPPPAGTLFEYIGELTAGFSSYQISAIGAFAKLKSGDASFFAFAHVAGSFGGPPAFFITGFMGGFGYNSALALPSVDQVAAFPFLTALGDPSVFPDPTPMGVLDVLTSGDTGAPWVTPAAGDQWFAAGIQFTSFDLVQGRALLIADLGSTFQLALLGTATMTLPPNATDDETKYAYLELQLDAQFMPDAGFVGIAASLSPNSYVLTGACQLTGGFAYYQWFGDNPDAGDFVVSVGGYAPGFIVPRQYPQVSAVGFSWSYSGDITIKGGAYLALTPSAFMVGGNLEVLFADGNLNAWFTAYANVLVTWKPFSFAASIGISIGASYTLNLLFTSVTLSVELGASLTLWGPPTGGSVTIDWSVISFTIGFGADQPSALAQTLDWAAFSGLLPHTSSAHAALFGGTASADAQALLSVHVNDGLSTTVTVAGDTVWVVRSDRFAFASASPVPASVLQIGTGANA